MVENVDVWINLCKFEKMCKKLKEFDFKIEIWSLICCWKFCKWKNEIVWVLFLVVIFDLVILRKNCVIGNLKICFVKLVEVDFILCDILVVVIRLYIVW